MLGCYTDNAAILDNYIQSEDDIGICAYSYVHAHIHCSLVLLVSVGTMVWYPTSKSAP
jgi:hypothetical protein